MLNSLAPAGIMVRIAQSAKSFVKGVANRYCRKREETVREDNFQRSRTIAMSYSPQHIANYFLEKAEQEKLDLTQLKLLKLVYIAYGWNLALTGEKLYNEQIEAWKHGPVIPSLYHEFKDYRAQPIDRRSISLDLDTWEASTPEVPRDDAKTRLILDRVWESYKRFSGWSLREKTHEPDSPWSRVYVDGVRGIRLRDSDIQEHFTHKIREYLDAARAVEGVGAT